MPWLPATIDGWFQALLAGSLLIYVVRRWCRAFRNRPPLRDDQIRYEEWFASGQSLSHPIGALGISRGCVHLIVTEEWIWVTSWFPFILLAPLCDMEHVIPIQRLEYMRDGGMAVAEGLELAYRDEKDRQHRLFLQPRSTPRFAHAVRSAASHLPHGEPKQIIL